MSKSVGHRQKLPSAKTGRLFRLAGHLGGTEERGPGKGALCNGSAGSEMGRVNVNHKLASITADAGRGEIRKVVGEIRAISVKK